MKNQVQEEERMRKVFNLIQCRDVLTGNKHFSPNVKVRYFLTVT